MWRVLLSERWIAAQSSFSWKYKGKWKDKNPPLPHLPMTSPHHCAYFNSRPNVLPVFFFFIPLMMFIINQMLNPPLQAAKVSHLQYFSSFSLSIPWKCFSWEEGKPSAPRPKFQWSWQLDAKFTVWNKMQWNVANRAAVAFSIFFQSQRRRAVNAALLYFLFYFFFLSGQRCTARQGDVGGTRRMDPMGTVNTSPTRKHWAALCVFQRWFLNFAERKWPGEEACLFFQSPPPQLEHALSAVRGCHENILCSKN